MPKLIEGVGKDAPVETLPTGGRQSAVPARLELIDGVAMMRIGRVLKEGREKYGEDEPGQENWKKIPVRSHLNKALIHIYSYLAGDTQDEHLDHAFCRIMMAVATEYNPLKQTGLDDGPLLPVGTPFDEVMQHIGLTPSLPSGTELPMGVTAADIQKLKQEDWRDSSHAPLLISFSVRTNGEIGRAIKIRQDGSRSQWEGSYESGTEVFEPEEYDANSGRAIGEKQ